MHLMYYLDDEGNRVYTLKVREDIYSGWPGDRRLVESLHVSPP